MTEEFLSYKGKPLVRCGNTIYYGKMTDPLVVMMQISESEKKDDVDTATKVTLHLMKTEPSVSPLERIIKKGEQDSLFHALEMADIWLSRQ